MEPSPITSGSMREIRSDIDAPSTISLSSQSSWEVTPLTLPKNKLGKKYLIVRGHLSLPSMARLSIP